MAYHGYTNLICQFIDNLPNYRVRILEIGTLNGETLIPLVHHLLKTNRPFEFVAIDIYVRENLKIILSGMGLSDRQIVKLVENNSLEVLPKLNGPFDLILIDGDHNYYTVSEELNHIERLSLPHTIVLCDDYYGKWSNTDLYYGEREEYQKILGVTKRQNTEKEGVAPAIDEWLEKHQNWEGHSPIKGEPILMQLKTSGLIQIFPN